MRGSPDRFHRLDARIVMISGLPRFALPAMLLLNAAPALAQTKDNAPVSLQSARKMAQDQPGTESWTYAQPTSRFASYRTVIVDPTVVYQGPDAQFDGIEPADRVKYAGMITDELRSELAKTFPAPATSASRHAETAGYDPRRDQDQRRHRHRNTCDAARLCPSALKSALGKGGTFTGSLLYAVELY